ncbi:MAG: glycosyltransferase [Verrucomicrobiia bacterium]|jgi:GT2 family glycosyltransferase
MNISIVVPAFNEAKLLPETLRSIKNAATVFTLTDWSWELVVCDNNSTDATAAIAREAGATVVFEPHNQISRARNTGARAASGDWLLFIDADSTPSWKHFENVRNCIRSGRHLAGGSNVLIYPTTWWANLFQGCWNWTSRLVHLAAGSFLYAERRAFEAVDGFSEKLYASEELSLSVALNQEAKKRGLLPLHIMTSPMLYTSGRKINLYTSGEHLRLVLRSVTNMRGAMESQDTCHIWYDGRR